MRQTWQFSAIPCIEESTFNKILERFYNFGISGLVRENIQNSLDGKLKGSDEPVIVTIKTGSVSKNDIPGLDEIKERIKSLKGQNSYTKETIEHMKNKMDDEIVNYISFEDFNTKGLTGANRGQSNNPKDTWSIYAYNKGVHTEEEDESVEKSRGGSHGIGKIASNAASDLYMMYFANCDADGNKHLGGTVQLIEHKFGDNHYRSTGYFTDVKNIGDNKTKFYPFENTFHEIFSKDTRGLKIIIPFLRDQFNNEDEIIKSICDSFFIAILENKLRVIVNEETIDKETIKNYIKNERYYAQNVEEIKKDFTPLYFDTYTEQEPIELNISDLKDNYNFNLFFNYDTSIVTGRVGIIRTIGMKIEDKKVKNNVRKPFNAVLIPKSIKEDAFLKSLENESHTELSFEHIKDQKIQKNAKKFIANISNEMAKIIENAIKQNNPTDGVMDTKDIIYEVENKFKKDLSKSMPTVKLNTGNKEKTLVKIPTEVPKKKDIRKNKKPSKPRKPAVKKAKPKEQSAERETTRYNANPEIVERVVVANNEYVNFDFSSSDDFKKSKLCDISIAVVDGMGNEYANEFDMKKNYESVTDLSTGKQLKIEDNLIKGVKIKTGNAQIQLKLKENYNRALKFVYYVEV
ncbi:MAG: hypothetical protein SOX50_13495 [Terrisporobacter othiniensis]|uniref:hypothetical protein n=1 Tax=Terrisporobacter othiniensis TaxID=1577792 RepID=UPI002A75A309|nr:hypothetical protein [Terrisporobacter othiniensis]MDY3374272.1 hypothetical protein [Terrisporobacter othiniensis]